MLKRLGECTASLACIEYSEGGDPSVCYFDTGKAIQKLHDAQLVFGVGFYIGVGSYHGLPWRN